MSRPEQRSDQTQVVPFRPDLSPASHLRSIRSWLGKQAAIGGRPYVERIVKSDEFAQRFLNGLDGDTRMAALASVAAIMAKAPEKVAPYKPASRNDRVRVKWTDEREARFRIEAPLSKDDFDLCRRMGLPPDCRGAMRAARARILGLKRASATVNVVTFPKAAPPAFEMALAA